jgi:hypothetical protein
VSEEYGTWSEAFELGKRDSLSRRVAELEGALRGVIDYAAAYYTPSGEGQVAQGRALVAARAALKEQAARFVVRGSELYDSLTDSEFVLFYDSRKVDQQTYLSAIAAALNASPPKEAK